MMLHEIKVTQCAKKPQHVLAVRSINSAYDESAPTVSCSISMKMHIKTLF
jgi:hypothetical protein